MLYMFIMLMLASSRSYYLTICFEYKVIHYCFKEFKSKLNYCYNMGISSTSYDANEASQLSEIKWYNFRVVDWKPEAASTSYGVDDASYQSQTTFEICKCANLKTTKYVKVGFRKLLIQNNNNNTLYSMK